jgi:hypothetical protein
MGNILSAIDDDYDEYVYLCKKLKIEPKEFDSWSYDDSYVVKLVRDKTHSYSKSYRI